jgi:hypothetical protein
LECKFLRRHVNALETLPKVDAGATDRALDRFVCFAGQRIGDLGRYPSAPHRRRSTVTEFAPYQGGTFQPPPSHPGPARSLRVAGWVAMIALGLIGAEALAAAALQAFLYPAMVGAVDPTATQRAVDEFLHTGERLIATVLLIVAGTSFISWLHRARTNLDGPGGREMTWTPGWSVGGWLLPLGNLVIPQLVVSEVDRVSERRADEAEGRPHERRRGVVVAWVVLWSLFLVVSQVGRPALALLDPGPSVLLGSVSGIFEAVTAGCAILLVRRVTANQERLRAALTRLRQAPTGDAAPAMPGRPEPASPGAPTPASVRPAAPAPELAFPDAPELPR